MRTQRKHKRWSYLFLGSHQLLFKAVQLQSAIYIRRRKHNTWRAKSGHWWLHGHDFV